MMDKNGRPKGTEGLDPLAQPDRWERLVSSIVTAASPELARRRLQQDVAGVVISWARPALSAAATVALLFSGAMALASRTSQDVLAAIPVVESTVVPEEMVAWLVAGYEPTVEEIVVAVEDFGR